MFWQLLQNCTCQVQLAAQFAEAERAWYFTWFCSCLLDWHELLAAGSVIPKGQKGIVFYNLFAASAKLSSPSQTRRPLRRNSKRVVITLITWCCSCLLDWLELLAAGSFIPKGRQVFYFTICLQLRQNWARNAELPDAKKRTTLFAKPNSPKLK